MQAESCPAELPSETLVYSDRAVAGRPSKKKPKESGARLAALRKAAGLSQPQLANLLGIPQRTLSYYERDGRYIPSTLIPALAKSLGVSIEELLGVANSHPRKRGPKSRLERQLERISRLPRNQQEKILAVVEAFIDKHAHQG